MQYLDDHMDDLFRRAGEDYPLNTGNADWKAVLEKLNTGEDNKPAAPLLNTKSKIYKRTFFLILLLIVSVAGYKYAVKDNSSNQDSNKNQAENKTANSRPSKPNDAANTIISENKKVIDPAIDNALNTTSPVTADQVTAHNNVFLLTKSPRLSIMDGEADESDSNNENRLTNPLVVMLAANEKIVNEIRSGKIELPAPVNNKVKEAGNYKKTATTSSPNGLYAGVTAGINFNKSASMGFGNAGFDGGLLLGYRFSSSLSIESGISFTGKKYASSGKDFNMDKIKDAMPSGMTIMDIRSNTSVIEIPVKARIDLYKKKESSFFITGGLSSYIVTKEFNQYNVSMNGQQDKLTGMYSSNSFVMPATAAFSAGYQKNISKNTSIRIEPFSKVPLRGIGVGDLQVTTLGVQLAFTRNFK